MSGKAVSKSVSIEKKAVSKDQKSLEKHIEERRAELAKLSIEKKKADQEKQKELIKSFKETLRSTKARDEKHLSPEMEAKRKALQEERAAQKKNEEEARRAENRRLQAMLKSAGPRAGSASGTRRPSESFGNDDGAVTRREKNTSGRNLLALAAAAANGGGGGGSGMLQGGGGGSSSAGLTRKNSTDVGRANQGLGHTLPGGSRSPAVISDDDDVTPTRQRVSSDETKQPSSGTMLGVTSPHRGSNTNSRDAGLSPSPRFRPGEDVRWKKVEMVGKGANGKVYSAILLETGQFIAVKQYRLKDEGLDKTAMTNFQKEIEVMEDLCHPNIVQYLGSEFRNEDEDEEFNIFLEFIPGNSLETLLAKTGPLDESVARLYLKQILQGCAYLHANGIVHRDIKCANILISNSGEIKLTDFGTAKKIRDGTMNGCQTFSGTPFWMAPEVIKNEEYGKKADVWSIGCTLVEMLTGKHPWFPLQNPFAVMFHVTNTTEPPEIPTTTSESAIDFLSLCLQRDPELRPTVDELLEHDYVNSDDYY